MKSNEWRKVIIKAPKLKQLRKNLRKVLQLGINDEKSGVALLNAYHDSILNCSMGFYCQDPEIKRIELDMVWNPIDRQWICINCYENLFGTDKLKNAYIKFLEEHEPT